MAKKLKFSEPQRKALRLLDDHPLITDVLFGGSAGPGKSWFGCHWQIGRRLFNAGTRGFIGRDSLINLKNTTLETFYEVWNNYYADNPFGVKIKADGQKNIINFSNGSFIYLKGLSYNSSDPEFTSLGSLEITDAFIDEVNGCSKKGVEILTSRIRYKLINNKSPILMTANPGYDWVRKRFWKTEKDEEVLLRPHEAFIFTTLSDNPDPVFRENYKKQLEHMDPYDRDRLLYGDWDAVRKAINPFFHAFRRDKHVRIADYQPNLPIYISLDFNLNPFCALFIQTLGKKIWVYDEVSIENGSIFKMCDEINARIPNGKVGMVRVTGDAMGNRKEIGDRENRSLYQEVAKQTGINPMRFDVTGNPFHSTSRVQCNKAFLQLDVNISPRCTGFIRDCELVEADANGKILKKYRKDETQRADFLDDFRYFINKYMRKYL